MGGSDGRSTASLPDSIASLSEGRATPNSEEELSMIPPEDTPGANGQGGSEDGKGEREPGEEGGEAASRDLQGPPPRRKTDFTYRPRKSNEPPRVIPQLCDYLLRRSQPFQEHSLELFLSEMDSLAQMEVKQEDMVLLLAVLFKILQRVGGVTPLEQYQNSQVASAALRVLHCIFSRNTDIFPVGVRAMHAIFDSLKLRVAPPKPQVNAPNADPLDGSGARRMQTPPIGSQPFGFLNESDLKPTTQTADPSPSDGIKELPDEETWREQLFAERYKEIIKHERERQQKWQEFCSQSLKASVEREQLIAEEEVESTDIEGLDFFPSDLYMDFYVGEDTTRGLVTELFRIWDASGLPVGFFVRNPILHWIIPRRVTQHGRVFRDFAVCPPRPPQKGPWQEEQYVHIKTNIPAKSDVMYRFMVEGYNYGANAPIHSDILGYTHRRWDKLGSLEDFGWPEGWDKNSSHNFGVGARIEQYLSSDDFVVIKLVAKSFVGVMFSTTCFLLHHDFGADFHVAAEFSFADDDL